MSKRRKRGYLDPDYRRKGWNQSAFAPKHSPFNITQISLIPAVAVFYLLYTAPALKSLMQTMNGFVVAGGACFVVWVGLALLLRRWEWRRVQKRLKPEEPLTFDEPDDPPTPSIRRAAPVDPIQQQLDQRRARLQGQVEHQAMNPRGFEHEVASLVNALTDFKAVVVGGAGDGGVDIKVYDSQQRLRGIVQCKYYQSAISPRHVRELYAAKQQFGVGTAYLVTSSYFTEETRKEAERLDIKLRDGKSLEEMRQKAKQMLRERDERQLFSA